MFKRHYETEYKLTFDRFTGDLRLKDLILKHNQIKFRVCASL